MEGRGFHSYTVYSFSIVSIKSEFLDLARLGEKFEFWVSGGLPSIQTVYRRIYQENMVCLVCNPTFAHLVRATDRL